MTAEGERRRPSAFTRDEWRLVLLLAAINFTHIVDFVIIMPLGDRLREELSITPQQFSFVVSVYGLAAMCAGVAAAVIVDRFDRKSVLLSSFAGFVVATLYCGLAPDYRQLLLARGLAGLFGGVAASGVMAYISDLFPAARRGRAIGAVTSSFAVASIIGLPIGLKIANDWRHWSAPFLAIAGLGAAVWVIAAWRLPSLRGQRPETARHPLVEFAAVLQRPNHLRSFAFMVTMVFGTFMIVPFIAPYLEANCGVQRDRLPVIYAVAGACTLVTLNVAGGLADRWGPRRVFLCAASGTVLLTLLMTNLPPITLPIAVLVTSLFMATASSRMVPAQAMMLQSADPWSRGAFTSLNTAMSHFATAVGPLISGAIIGERWPGGPLTRYPVVGLVAIGFGVVAIGLSFLLHPAPAEIVETVTPAGPTAPQLATLDRQSSV